MNQQTNVTLNDKAKKELRKHHPCVWQPNTERCFSFRRSLYVCVRIRYDSRAMSIAYVSLNHVKMAISKHTVFSMLFSFSVSLFFFPFSGFSSFHVFYLVCWQRVSSFVEVSLSVKCSNISCSISTVAFFFFSELHVFLHLPVPNSSEQLFSFGWQFHLTTKLVNCFAFTDRSNEDEKTEYSLFHHLIVINISILGSIYSILYEKSNEKRRHAF